MDQCQCQSFLHHWSCLYIIYAHRLIQLQLFSVSENSGKVGDLIILWGLHPGEDCLSWYELKFKKNPCEQMLFSLSDLSDYNGSIYNMKKHWNCMSTFHNKIWTNHLPYPLVGTETIPDKNTILIFELFFLLCSNSGTYFSLMYNDFYDMRLYSDILTFSLLNLHKRLQ